MQMFNRHRAPVIAVVVLFSVSSLLAAKVPPDGAIAPMEVSRASIRWSVQVPTDGVTLTVTRPDGEVLTKEFRSSNVILTLQDLDRSAEDGTYTYQLVVTPPVPSHVKQQMQK
ncbi:MAG TPA: hypothetical protein VFT12_04875, partial [Thermoanaerobaculia bacterium]|nr:hypothetical protein [Thermoanaerobaculia bacterium]